VTRRLQVVDATDPRAVLRALRGALSGDGPAVLPRDAGAVEAQASPPLPDVVAQNVALVVETSGSTGAPKRVVISADSLLASAAASSAALGAPGQWLLALPTHYIAGIQVLVRSLAAGTEPAILPPGHFDPGAFESAAAGMMPDVPHYVSLVPVQLARLLDAAADDPGLLAALRRFDAFVVGGQALAEELRLRALGHGLRVVRTYGSTETCGGCVYDGVPLGPVHARTVDGEVELAGPMLAEGYLGEPERTERVFHVDDGVRWYRTGDLGVVDDGVVRITGRAGNVIISGGVKVSLDAVERAARGLPGFAEAVAVGCEDEEWGEVPVVVVPGVERMPAPASTALEPQDSALLALLRDHVGRALGPAARPTRIVALSAMPLLSSGKPDRVAIARAVAERARG